MLNVCPHSFVPCTTYYVILFLMTSIYVFELLLHLGKQLAQRRVVPGIVFFLLLMNGFTMYSTPRFRCGLQSCLNLNEQVHISSWLLLLTRIVVH